MSITRIKKYVANFSDNNGDSCGKKSFSSRDSLIKFKDRQFNTSIDRASHTVFKRWYWDVHNYFYNIHDPNPLMFKKSVAPLMDSELYNIQLETKVARDLNDLSKKVFLDLFTPPVIITIIAIIGVIIAMSTGIIKIH